MSETATCRERLAKYCVGTGVDLGFGGDPITPAAICIDRDERSGARSHHDHPMPTHIVGDIWNLQWFQDGALDYIYSSHALEDAINTQAVLSEWMRVVRPGGLLVLFLPDQKTYEAYCRKEGSSPNAAHVHADFSLEFVKSRLPEKSKIISEVWPFPGNPYSFALVAQKT